MERLALAAEIAARSLLILAAILAWFVARPQRFAPARPLAHLLLAEAAIDLTRWVLRVHVLAPARAAGRTPFHGLERALFHVDQALLVGWTALTLAFVLRAFLKPAGRLVGALWALVLLVLVLAYPSLRGMPLIQVYRGLHAAGTAAGIVVLVLYLVREGRPGRMQRAAIVLLAGDVAAFAGPYLHPVVTDWPLAHLQNVVLYGVLCFLLGRWLWTPATRSPGSCSPSPPSRS